MYLLLSMMILRGKVTEISIETAVKCSSVGVWFYTVKNNKIFDSKETKVLWFRRERV